MRQRLLVFTLLAVLVLAGFLVAHQSTKKTAEQNPPSTASTTQNSADETDEQKTLAQHREQLAQAIASLSSVRASDQEKQQWKKFNTTLFGFSILYPGNTLLVRSYPLDQQLEGRRSVLGVQFFVDSPQNREYIANKSQDSDGEPPNITVTVYKNDAARHALSAYVPPIIISDISQFPGVWEKIQIDGKDGLIYPWRSIDSHEAVLIRNGYYTYEFSVTVTGANDQLRLLFYKMLSTIFFIS